MFLHKLVSLQPLQEALMNLSLPFLHCIVLEDIMSFIYLIMSVEIK